MLNGDAPFKGDEKVKIILEPDFKRIGDRIKTLNKEKEELMDRIQILHNLLDIQEIENNQDKTPEERDRITFLKELIKL